VLGGGGGEMSVVGGNPRCKWEKRDNDTLNQGLLSGSGRRWTSKPLRAMESGGASIGQCESSGLLDFGPSKLGR